MPLSGNELENEQAYLDTVMGYLTHRLDQSRLSLEKNKAEVIELNRTMMEDIGNDVQSLGKFVDAYSYLVEIDSRAGVMHDKEIEYVRLLQMANSPYFARMDFRIPGGDPMKIYIGIGSLMEEKTMDVYVFDWRSPIAGMYYDYELGEASYEAPRGTVTGEITLKRQFRIWKGEILSAYDSALAIEDDILSEALAKSADSKMQSIVCTIQREQNKIIRDRDSRYLVAFGPAGSGKTSVAMQRAAFFLYAYRDTVTAANLMIFSPNNVFGDYISEVLPRLGEANIKSTTFNAYAEALFDNEYRFLPSSEFLDFAAQSEGIRERAAKLKLSDELYYRLRERVERLSGSAPDFPDMVYDGTCLMTGAEMDELYTGAFSYLSIQARMNKIYARVAAFAKEEHKRKLAAALDAMGTDEADEKEAVIRKKWEIREEYKAFLSEAEHTLCADPVTIYLSVLESMDREVAAYTKEHLAEKVAQSEDAAPLLYLLSSTREIKNEVRYLIIDEAQDYTRLHFEAIRACFKKAGITFLGDSNQTVCPLSPAGSEEVITSVFPEATVCRLNKSYRSTAQISAFCGKLLDLENVDYMKREGEPVSMTTLHSHEDYRKALARQAASWRDEGKTVAVIFPTADECRSFYDAYGQAAHLTLISGQDKTFRTGAVVLPVYMAKGLEFDGVVIPYESFQGDNKKHLLYTACTRALHVLKLFRDGTEEKEGI